MADAFVAALGLDYMTLDCVYEAARRRPARRHVGVNRLRKFINYSMCVRSGGVPITYTALDNNAAEGEKGAGNVRQAMVV